MLRPPSQDQLRRLSGDHLRRGICGPGDDTGHDGSVGDQEMLQPASGGARPDDDMVVRWLQRRSIASLGSAGHEHLANFVGAASSSIHAHCREHLATAYTTSCDVV
jgi:hypothetical protein